MNSELDGRKTGEGSHGQVVRMTKVNRELFLKILQRIEGVTGMKTFLILTVVVFGFAVVPGE